MTTDDRLREAAQDDSGRGWKDGGRDVLEALATALAEIAKCDLVCSNCHRIRTAARKRQKLLPREGFRPHGRAGWIDPQSKKSEQSRHDERTGAAG